MAAAGRIPYGPLWWSLWPLGKDSFIDMSTEWGQVSLFDFLNVDNLPKIAVTGSSRRTSNVKYSAS